MTKPKNFLSVAPLLVLFPLFCAAQDLRDIFLKRLPEAMVTVKVVGEDGQPVEGAEVGVGFGFGKQRTGRPGLSDLKGNFTAQSPAIEDITFGAIKDGYYRTVGKPLDLTEEQNGRWLPWNPTLTVVLKKTINPVPMYAKRVDLVVPMLDKPVGFDLMEGDWVAPHGGGKVSDFVFQVKLQKRSGSDYDYCLTLTFSNSNDGIQPFEAPYLRGSELKSPHEAPSNGYLSQWIQTRSERPGKTEEWTKDEKRNYFFRVRSSADGAGVVTKALYGKIYGDFMDFVYYLNPDGTRNVEFDPKRNLFNDLKRREQVQHP